MVIRHVYLSSRLYLHPTHPIPRILRIPQVINNAIQFCGLHAIFDITNPQGQLEATLESGRWAQNVDFSVWRGVSSAPVLIVSFKDIRQLDFLALRRAGYRGAVFDKDNCLADNTVQRCAGAAARGLSHRRILQVTQSSRQDAWKECRHVFGDGNVLIASNSAVLRYNAPKPVYACIGSIRGYFSTLKVPVKDEELVVVGDRIFTDVVMANRMHCRSGEIRWQSGRQACGRERV
ncbi:hypothetical protein JVU11DRAFT_2294 [Chiua virens]|nr:hypothetical protein JVU11DRAFT_2294 [Chiua virens]